MKIKISLLMTIGLISMMGCSNIPLMGAEPAKPKYAAPVTSKADAAVEGVMDVVENFDDLDEGCLGLLSAFKACEVAPAGPIGIYKKGCDYAAESSFECAVSSTTLRSFMSFL